MDERLIKTNDTDRNSRTSEVREDAESTLSSAKERRKMFREFSQEALPTPPDLPGWHYCWLSLTNQYDPIYKRVRMGYEPVKADELPEFTHLRIKSGEYENCVSINEMILFKIPNEIYQEIMEENHYYRPLEEEERVKQSAQPVGKDSNGKDLGVVEGDGFSDMAARVRVPTFN